MGVTRCRAASQKHLTLLLLAMIAISAVQSSVQTFIHNAILSIDTSLAMLDTIKFIG